MLCVLLSGVLAAPAFAGALYRCTGSTGETVFSGTAAGYKDCKRIGSTPAARPARPFHAPSAASSLPDVVLAPGKASASGAAPATGGSPTPPVDLAATPRPSFKGVSAGVVGPDEPVTSLVGVVGGVVTDAEAKTEAAKAELPPVMAPKGSWDYKESASTDLAASPAPAAPSGSRVLRGAVYRITRADGGVEYTNIPQAAAEGRSVKMLFTYIATCVACDVHSRIDFNSVALNLTSYGDVIRTASVDYHVDEALLRAVIHAESAFNPRALSVAGAQGLMQLIPSTARDMGVRDAFDAEQNIRGGARYLALLLQNFNGNERLAAAAYNAGPGAVQRYNGVPPYDETQVYVERVGLLRKRYTESLRRPGTGVPLADRGAM
ncbi:lytic transglycosylase domain-containing protein [Bacillus sp. NP157]|nr:lytic transglycosylase domain-containing protein [Bacillus sp. NP157]